MNLPCHYMLKLAKNFYSLLHTNPVFHMHHAFSKGRHSQDKSSKLGDMMIWKLQHNNRMDEIPVNANSLQSQNSCPTITILSYLKAILNFSELE